MDNKSLTLRGDAQVQLKAVFPPAWQLNDLQRTFIEDLWQPEFYEGEPPNLADNL
jgi:hypothetical protein